MVQEVVNVGTEANDGSGDTLRSGFIKTNNNFSELYDATILNLGSDEALFTGKQSANFLLKGIGAGPNTVVSSNSTSIIIDLLIPAGDVSGGLNLTPGEGVFAQKNSGTLEFKGLVAGPNVILTSNSVSIEIDSVLAASVVGASNLGLGVGVFFEKSGDILEFRSISSANTANIIISGNATSVIIDAFVGGGGGGEGTITGAANITSGPGEGVFAQENSGVLEFRSLVSANSSNVLVSIANNTNIVIDAFVDRISDSTRFYDIFVYVPSTMSSGELLYEAVFPRQVDFDVNLANSETFAGLVSTADANIAILKNDVLIGNIVFAAATAEATFDLLGGASFADEDRLTLVAPASADATLGNVRITIVGATTILGGGAGDNAIIGGANLSTGSDEGVFAQQNAGILEFRSLVSANTANLVISSNATNIILEALGGTGGGGGGSYTSLTDTPSDFTDAAGKIPQVNADEDAIEFVDKSIGSFGNPFSGALVKNASDLAGDFDPQTSVTWDTEVYDIGGWHSNSVNTDRLTVPAGVTKIRLTGAVFDSTGGVSDSNLLEFTKNGAGGVTGSSALRTHPDEVAHLNSIASPVLDVVAGDYFTLAWRQQADDTSTIDAARSHFSIEAVESVAPASKVIGPWLQLDRQVVSGVSEVDFTFNPDLYDDYELVMHDVVASGDSFEISLRVSEDGGATFKSGGTDYSLASWNVNEAAASGSGGSTTGLSYISITGSGAGNVSNEKSHALVRFQGLDSSTEEKHFQIEATNVNISNQINRFVRAGRYEASTNQINGLRIFETGGDTITGTFILRGRPKAGVDFYSSNRSLTGMPFSGALVKLDGDLTTDFSAGIPVLWESTEYDIGEYWNSGNPERLTIPTGVTKVRLTMYVRSTGEDTTAQSMSIKKNGEFDYIGSAQTGQQTTLTTAQQNIVTSVIEVVAGDYFEAIFQGSDTSGTISSDRSSFSIEAVEAIAPSVKPRGALVTKVSDELTVDLDPITTISWNAEVYDTDDIHDNSTNNSRLTVPSGVTHVRLIANLSLLLVAANEWMSLRLEKNGAVFDGAGYAKSSPGGSTQPVMNISTSIIEVIAGDYFEVLGALQSDDSVTIEAARSWFSMEIIETAVVAGAHEFLTLRDTPPSYSGKALNVARVNLSEDAIELVDPSLGSFGNPFSGATIYITQDQDTDTATWITLNWDASLKDIGGWWTSGAASRFTVPSGITKIRIQGRCGFTNSGTGVARGLRVQKNGVTLTPNLRSFSSAESGVANVLNSDVIDCVPGDYFEMQIYHDMGGGNGAISIDESTWFSIEAVESVAPASKVIGPWLELDRQNVSAVTEIDFTFNPDLYDEIEIVGRNVTSNNDDWVPAIRVSDDGGATFEAGASDYDFTVHIVTSSDSHSVTQSTAGASFMGWWTGFGNVGDEKGDFTITSYDLANITHEKTFKLESIYADAATNNHSHTLGSGRYKAATSTKINGIRFFETGGDSLTGEFILRGRPKAGIDFYSSDRSLTGMPFSGAMAKLDADLVDVNYSSVTAVPFESQIQDVGGWWSSGVPTRLTVPAGVTKVRVSGNFWANSLGATNDLLILIHKNGSGTWDGVATLRTQNDITSSFSNLSTGVVDVIPGDYFELAILCPDTTITVQSESTNFSIEAVEAIAPAVKPRGALVNQATSFSLPNNSTTVVPWDNEVYDTDNIHDNSVNNTRLTVPSGVTHVRLTGAYWDTTNTSGWRFIDIYKNDAIVDGAAIQSHGATGSNNHGLSVVTAVLEVVGGDYFTMRAFQNSGSAEDLTGENNWFSMEIIETAVIAGPSIDDQSIKESVVCATTADGTLATAFVAGNTVDDVTLALGDRILLKNQSAGEENGIRIVPTSGVPRRADDANTTAKLRQGSIVFVSEGTVNGATSWLLDTDDPIVLDTTSQNWESAGGGGGGGATVIDDLTDVDTTTVPPGAGQTLGWDGTNWTPASANALEVGQYDLLHIQHQETSGTDGGTVTASMWNIRPLNTIITNEIAGASIDSNEFTLSPGTYEINYAGVMLDLTETATRLFNVTTASAVPNLGLTEYNASADSQSRPALLKGRVTVTVITTFRIEHWASTTKSLTGFGFAITQGTEIYADCLIRRITPVQTVAGLPFKGALVERTSGDTAITSTVSIQWEAEIYDVGGWFDSGSDTRLTVPAGVTKVRITASPVVNSQPTDIQFLLDKNGAGIVDAGGGYSRGGSQITVIHSAVLDVVAGDYFEITPVFGSGTPNIRASAWFSIEAVEAVAPSAKPRGALVKRLTNQSIGNAAFETVEWNDEVYDTDNIHDTSTNNERLTVPSGVTHIRLGVNIAFDTHTTGVRQFNTLKNGVELDEDGAMRASVEGNGSFPDYLNGSTGVIEVTSGDYFEIEVFQNRGGVLDIISTNPLWFSMEIIEPAVVVGDLFVNATLQTTDATKTNITRGLLAAGEVATIWGEGNAIETSTGDVYWFTISGAVKNISGTTSLVGTPKITEDSDIGAASWTVGLEADDTADAWELTVTGQASKTIEWKISSKEVKQ